MEYLEDVEADFLAIYHQLDPYTSMTGPKFLLLAQRLPLYDGAVRRRLELDFSEDGAGGGSSYGNDADFSAGETMSMKQALARSRGDSTAELMAMNQQAMSSSLGPLFDYETG